ncbi:bifunctional diaminohydroxyphosphoribosylaminopyrimidine deaminase/5-amino-6-(5-phosphoribosylamino)uracil reductase RibD [Dyella jiangningensis]|uniref:bifunctional diaminohydroxyphosphoribosylaminopyrimidine deaminase/5-amino-6-(5-phosphoribosylamino)uracil reductase RibD n=1 Tax=Dyella jiangningensis TaxID=1379159 RepID=UPI002410A24E|nr:bifunctional diaminohydroxyphosphoribosylaminopyrimidine deaminase/5-amino-6-(5-phosphoribosylamino)uracil reductase RibD [Dyella jiangningensis]MDG2537009.1 bifunctional diaminohydroxyphosphoribosylaminopyrimidine deaminase/5-amino-6-(5-phosphoribosylamino)uracil reductase RibD [Dyella jiangningensis]
MTPTFTAIDHAHMAHALRLAARGLYTTHPNPRVGCVIAHGEQVIGTGFHQRAGEPHAEVFALREAAEQARGATAYVTLEPCAHHGRTPPCADALIAAGVSRVVIAAEDPFPQVAGRGIGKLRDAGIVADTGLMREAARELNMGFFSRIERGRPWVRVKLAMSLDGRTALANGESKWITGEAARADVQRWRARSSAILTGSGTVLADNPRLTVRLPEGEAFTPPWRVLLDNRLRTPPGSHVLDGTAPTLVLHNEHYAPMDARFQAVELAVVAEQGGAVDLHAVMAELARRHVSEVHVEAGPTLCGSLLAAGLVDELLLYIAPVLLGDSARPLLGLPSLTDMADRWKLRTLDRRVLGDDLRLLLRPTT